MGTEHEGRGETATVSDPACGEQKSLWRVLCEQVGCFRHECQSASERAMSACFGALSDDDICSHVDGIPDVIDILTLTDEAGTGVANLIYERTWVPSQRW